MDSFELDDSDDPDGGECGVKDTRISPRQADCIIARAWFPYVLRKLGSFVSALHIASTMMVEWLEKLVIFIINSCSQ